MLQYYQDLTSDFNANNKIQIDVGMWQNVTVHFSGSISGTVNVTGTNDAGAVAGVSDGNPVSAANFTAIQATNLADGTAATSISSAGNYKITVGTRFIKVGGASAATTGNVIVFFTTPQ
jgi:hypothetical protein